MGTGALDSLNPQCGVCGLSESSAEARGVETHDGEAGCDAD
ncbi:hypothetical protein [Bifidobacterium avesanii]|nr:hypothetical protein [Bifidobacterium avesanii]